MANEKLISAISTIERGLGIMCVKQGIASECKGCPYSKSNSSCVDALMEDALTVINHLERKDSVQRWIPVTERLPEDSVAVNLHTRSGVVGTGFYNKYTKNWWQWYSGGSIFVDVTHWMPLPETPKGE